MKVLFFLCKGDETLITLLFFEDIFMFFPKSILQRSQSRNFLAVLVIWIRRIRRFLGLSDPVDPDSLVKDMDPDPVQDPSLFS